MHCAPTNAPRAVHPPTRTRRLGTPRTPPRTSTQHLQVPSTVPWPWVSQDGHNSRPPFGHPSSTQATLRHPPVRATTPAPQRPTQTSLRSRDRGAQANITPVHSLRGFLSLTRARMWSPPRPASRLQHGIPNIQPSSHTARGPGGRRIRDKEGVGTHRGDWRGYATGTHSLFWVFPLPLSVLPLRRAASFAPWRSHPFSVWLCYLCPNMQFFPSRCVLGLAQRSREPAESRMEDFHLPRL